MIFRYDNLLIVTFFVAINLYCRGDMKLKSEYCKKVVHSHYFISTMLRKLGITNKYIGYFYLIEILDLLINEGLIVNSFSGQVYPRIACRYNRSDHTIERDIRHIISILWDEKLKKILSPFCFYTNRPRCRQFIYAVKDYILNELNY